MPTPHTYKTEAVILRHTNLGEADRLLTLYTPHLGKLRAVAKGVRRPKSRKAGHLEPLTHSDLFLARGKTLDIITQAQTLESFLPLRNDLQRMSHALYAVELIDRFTEEHQEGYAIYQLLLNNLRWLALPKEGLAEGTEGQVALRYFELHLLNALGYRPQLHQCLHCAAQLEAVTNYFSPSAGGVLCPRCRGTEPVIRPLSPNALKTLRFLQTSSMPAAQRLKMGPELAFELEHVMRQYLRYLLEREVRSAAFLDILSRSAEGAALR